MGIEWEMQWAAAVFQHQGEYQPLMSSILGCFILIFSTVIGTVANGFALKYFFTKTNVFFNAFKLVALSDFLICQLSTFYGISLVKERNPLLFENDKFCLGWNMMWKIVVRFSLHLVAIQSTLRTIKIYRPLRPLSSLNLILTAVVSLDLTVISGVSLVGKTQWKPIFTKSWASCLENTYVDDEPIGLSISNFRVLVLLYAVLPYPVILACCVLCSFELVKRNFKSVNRRAHRLAHSIISLLVFSLTGFFLNMTSFAPLVVRNSLYEEINKDDKMKIWLYGNVILRQVNVTMNSVLNPFIFLWRMEEIRSTVTAVVQPFYETFSRYCRFRFRRNTLNTQRQIEVEPGGERVGISRPQSNIQIQNFSFRSLRQLVQQQDFSNNLILSNHYNVSNENLPVQPDRTNVLNIPAPPDITDDITPDIIPDITDDITPDIIPDITADISPEPYQYHDPSTAADVSCRAMVTEPELETTVIVHRNAVSHIRREVPISIEKINSRG